MLSFPASHTSEKRFRCHQGELWQFVTDISDEFGWEVLSDTADEFHVKVGPSLRSLGELMTIHLEPRSTVRATSKCALTAQCIDFGKNRANILKLFAAISERTHKSRSRRRNKASG